MEWRLWLQNPSFTTVNTNYLNGISVPITTGTLLFSPSPTPSGYGTPTNGGYVASFDATTITLGDLAKVVAQLIIDLKPTGAIAT